MPNAYENFKKALEKRPKATQDTYFEHARYYLGTQGFSDYEDMMADEAKDIQERIKNLIQQLSHAKANKLLAALEMFYDANELPLNWKHIRLFKPPKPEREQVDRPYHMDEMVRFYKNADIREQVAELAMGTGMPRIGALPGIRIDKDLIWLEDYKLYACLIYPLSDARYMTFFSPQASQHINEYKGKREKGYLFLNKREPDLPVKEGTLASAVWDVLVKSGMRVPGEKTDRHEVQMDHGFRKFGRTQLGNAGILKDHAEAMEGHNAPLVRIYDGPTALEYLKRTEYYKAIPYLALPI